MGKGLVSPRLLDPPERQVRREPSLLGGKPEGSHLPFDGIPKAHKGVQLPDQAGPDDPRRAIIGKSAKAPHLQVERSDSLHRPPERIDDGAPFLGGDAAEELEGQMDRLRPGPSDTPRSLGGPPLFPKSAGDLRRNPYGDKRPKCFAHFTRTGPQRTEATRVSTSNRQPATRNFEPISIQHPVR
jgi:hypothetical protein